MRLKTKLNTGAALRVLVLLHTNILQMVMVVLVLARVLDLLLCLPHFVEILETTPIHAMAVIIQNLLGVTDDLRSEPGSILLQPARAPWIHLGLACIFALLTDSASI